MIFVEYFKFMIQKHFEKQNLISNVLYFKDIHDVEFEVRTGPFPGDNQRCKLTCVKGQWVGPLCRTKESKKPLHTVWTVKIPNLVLSVLFLIARLARSDPRNSFLCRPCIFLFVLAFSFSSLHFHFCPCIFIKL